MTPNVSTPTKGVSFLHIPDTRFTTACITVSFYVPLLAETAGQYALIPYLLRRGCRRLENMTEFSRALDRLYGAAISADVSSAGETQILSLHMSCIDDRFAMNGETVAADCAKLLLEVLFDPPLENGVFRKEDVEQEKRCTLESIAAEINDKRRYARTKCKELLCGGEPYAVSKYGTKEQVEALDAAVLTTAWKTLLATAPVRIIYQGGGDSEAVKAAFCEKLCDRDVLTIAPVVTADAKAEVARGNESMDVNQCQLVMGFRTPVHGEHELSDAMRLMNALFGGTPHSLLFRHVREEQSLCYYCISRFDRPKGVSFVESGVEEDKLPVAEAEILRQLEAVKRGDFTDEELEHARLSVVDALTTAEDSASAMADWYSVQGPNRVRSPQETAESMRAVTREQVIAAANTVVLDSVFTLTPTAKEETV